MDLGVGCKWPRKIYADWAIRVTFNQLGRERFEAPEILFDPTRIGSEDPGVHQVGVLSESYCSGTDRF